MKIKLPTPTLIPVAELYEHEENPNVQDSTVYANLLSEIATDGFEEAIAVVKNENLGIPYEGYTVVSGNHRLRAAKELGIKELPCFIHNLTSEEVKIKLIRRNMLKGELNSKKFTKLVESIENNYTSEQLSELMGFKNIEEFERLYQKEVEDIIKQSNKFIPKEEGIIDGLSVLINSIFSEYGHTVPHSFMYFMQAGKMHLMIQMDDKLVELMKLITDKCEIECLDINSILIDVLNFEINKNA